VAAIGKLYRERIVHDIRVPVDEDETVIADMEGWLSDAAGPFRSPARQQRDLFGAGPDPGVGVHGRRTAPIDPLGEGPREAALDDEEGAALLMVKPALAYLDVIAKLRAASHLPLGAYNVSGEYAMVKAAAAAGMIDEKRATLEVLTSIRRAGADFILTYHAKDAVKLLR